MTNWSEAAITVDQPASLETLGQPNLFRSSALCFWPRPRRRTVFSDTDVFHGASGLDLPYSGKRFDHRQRLRLGNDFVAVRLFREPLRESTIASLTDASTLYGPCALRLPLQVLRRALRLTTLEG